MQSPKNNHVNDGRRPLQLYRWVCLHLSEGSHEAGDLSVVLAVHICCLVHQQTNNIEVTSWRGALCDRDKSERESSVSYLTVVHAHTIQLTTLLLSVTRHKMLNWQ